MSQLDDKTTVRIIKVPEENIVLKEGEISSYLFKILKGNAEVYVGYGTKHETLIGIIGPQACFGELGLLLHKPAVYTVVAYSELLVLRITENEMEEFIRENHKNVIDIMRNMANTMVTMSFQISLLIKEIEEGRKPDQESLKEIKRSLRRSLYNPRTAINDLNPGWNWKV